MNKRKIAIVTGGSSGLGLAIAEKFVRNNISVVIIGRDKKKLEEARNNIGDYCKTEPFDLTRLDKIPGLVRDIQERHKHIDILVNTAGIHMKKDLFEVTDEDFQKVIHTNLTSIFTLSRETARVMAVEKKGCIINISSMAAHYGIPGVVAYTAAKTGIEGMTRAFAVELSEFDIRVNCIVPGFIHTPMSETALKNDPERKKRIISRTPMRKLGSPEDVANAAFFLVSEDAGYMTGTIIPVDGGNSIGF